MQRASWEAFFYLFSIQLTFFPASNNCSRQIWRQMFNYKAACANFVSAKHILAKQNAKLSPLHTQMMNICISGYMNVLKIPPTHTHTLYMACLKHICYRHQTNKLTLHNASASRFNPPPLKEANKRLQFIIIFLACL